MKEHKQLQGACIIGQSGGPTAVINASVCGAVAAAVKNPNITRVLAAQHGIEGVLGDRLFDMEHEAVEEVALLTNTPAAALGSCRYKLSGGSAGTADLKKVLKIFKKYDVRYFFYAGGNDSMDTCNKISRYLKKQKYDCRVIGVPKTIDNDLAGTDHCPGFGSAAKYIATSVAEVSLDSRVYAAGAVTIIEVMGRNAGWLAGAAALADITGAGPDLIYIPEAAFDTAQFIKRASEIHEKKGNCIVVVSEGIKDKNGAYILESGDLQQKDAFGHRQMGGLADALKELVKQKLGCKARGIELSLLQRCAAHCASQTDIAEAYMSGMAAVEYAVEGNTGAMVGIERVPGAQYKCGMTLVDLADVANREKTVPRAWINESGDYVTQDFIDYALPLIQGEPERPMENGLPRFAKLNKHFVHK